MIILLLFPDDNRYPLLLETCTYSGPREVRYIKKRGRGRLVGMRPLRAQAGRSLSVIFFALNGGGERSRELLAGACLVSPRAHLFSPHSCVAPGDASVVGGGLRFVAAVTASAGAAALARNMAAAIAGSNAPAVSLAPFYRRSLCLFLSPVRALHLYYTARTANGALAL